MGNLCGYGVHAATGGGVRKVWGLGMANQSMGEKEASLLVGAGQWCGLFRSSQASSCTGELGRKGGFCFLDVVLLISIIVNLPSVLKDLARLIGLLPIYGRVD